MVTMNTTTCDKLAVGEIKRNAAESAEGDGRMNYFEKTVSENIYVTKAT